MNPALPQQICFLLLLAHLQGAPQSNTPLPSTGPAASIPTNAPVRNLGNGLFEIGSVKLDKNRQTVSFPAIVNLKETQAEYSLVTDYGKIHESILRTETQPYQIHLAMLLLGAKGAGTNALPQVPTLPPPGNRLRVEVAWKTGKTETAHPGESLVFNRRRAAPLTKTDWIYTGSSLFEGTFLAQQEGSIISLIDDPAALILYPGPERDDDENWTPNANALPDVETMVRVTLHLLPP